jgi:hypothetical protein
MMRMYCFIAAYNIANATSLSITMHSCYHLGVFSNVLNYVLRISCSKHDTLNISSTAPGEDDGMSKQGYGSAIVRQKAVGGGTEDDSGADLETVCVECFKFLKALAKDYFEIQMR